MTIWDNKIVVVAGGTRGLGLYIGLEFAKRGARIVLLGRNGRRLELAVDKLNQIRADCTLGFAVDLTDDTARLTTIAQIKNQLGGFDVWVNAVGESIRTRFLDADLGLYRRMMEQNFFASAGCSLAALPVLAERNGHLINIGSLAAKTPWPWLAPYVTSKHALSAFARQLRIEGPRNVHYLFVCNGPIASEENGRYSNQSRELPEHASLPGAGAPVSALEPGYLAKRIVVCCDRRKSELVLPWKARGLIWLSLCCPRFADRIIRRWGNDRNG
jgi:short-subunit dehydrogenase